VLPYRGVVPDDLWQYRGQLLAYANRRLPDPADAEDMVSETLLTAVEQCDGIIQARAFLFGLLRNDLGNAIARKRRRGALAHVAHDPPLSLDAETEALGSVTVAACLAFLTPPLRDVMVLIYLDGFTRADAAVKLGISRGVLNYRLSTARHLLRDCLRKDDL
jgi:RNA polymerase sigma-70 factor (ECF subfamily)